MTTILLQPAPPADQGGEALAEAVAGELGGRARPCAHAWRIETRAVPSPARLETLRGRHRCDLNLLPEGFDPAAVGLVISDMDSTLITIECIDEIADFTGLKPQVAAITEAAMRGEIDFETSLRRRVALLEGLPAEVLERVYEERLRLNPGAEVLVEGLRGRGIPFALVSGGFTVFTERLKARLGLDFTLANELEIAHGRLTGRVRGAIVGARAKAAFLEELCERLGIRHDQVIAMGDGANDLEMLARAGLGVAYRAKPALRARADVLIDHNGLDAVLAFLETC
ncbi:MAG TPA: phosphoserine phosphatase SerB [Gammaproteobacteria bacterium]|nr:phosphoserine phosphatase SerB [Gammaproteobacteria bacterium]